MEQLRDFLKVVKEHGAARLQLLALLHLLIGRRIKTADGVLVSAGKTWRETADVLTRARWDPDLIREIGLDPKALPVRDRERFWYTVIARAGVDSSSAVAAAKRLQTELAKLGYVIE